jgi:hypothetical protein
MVPAILGNSVLLDMLQDYFNQSVSQSLQDYFCKSLISVNGCSSEVSLHRSTLIIIHKKHFEKDNDNPIPAPAKERFSLISVNQMETIKSVSKISKKIIKEFLMR